MGQDVSGYDDNCVLIRENDVKGIELAIRVVDNYLARWGFKPKKTIKKYTSCVLKPSRLSLMNNIQPLRLHIHCYNETR
ncbi:MAG: hypothetical protein DID89_2727548075 [Candidatus Nitrotoga sp. CP45]|nr:MAG: hypothetical protein DID89_2727548075 [Candidatus Nitrotoga sp. CP45]